MTDDPGFYDLATKFPEAILALLGVETTQPYKAEAVEVKVTGRFDAVLSPAGGVVELAPISGDATRYYVEYQARADPDVERSLLLKVVAHCTKERWHGRARAIVFYANDAFRKASARADIRGRRGRRRDLVSFDVERIVLSRQLDPAKLAGRGWAARLAMPLVGDDDAVVVRGATRWLAELEAALATAPERQAAARELFFRLLADRLPDANVYALSKGLEDVVEHTATGRALIARGEAKGQRKAILGVLEARGLTVPAAVRERLDREDDPERLAAILRAAVSVSPDLSGLFPA